MLPPLVEGEDARARRASRRSRSSPSRRPAFSEATLVKALEESGIGRPSTYAAILSTLTDREYVDKVEGRFRPTPLGTMVNQLLQKRVRRRAQRALHRRLEQELDKIEEGAMPWKKAVREFDEKFDSDLATAGDACPTSSVTGSPPPRAARSAARPSSSASAATAPSSAAATTAPSRPATTRATSRPPRAEATTGAPARGDRPLREVRQADGAAPQPFRRLPRLHRLPGVQEHPQDRAEGRAAEGDRRRLPAVQRGDDAREEVAPRQGLLLLLALSGLRFRPLGPPDRRALSALQRPYLVEKISKRKGARLVCTREGCGSRGGDRRGELSRP